MLLKFATTIVLFSAAAPAQVASVSETGQAPKVQNDSDELVCQKVEKIGSRLATEKVCLTVREWRERRMADRDDTARAQAGTRVPGDFGN